MSYAGVPHMCLRILNGVRRRYAELVFAHLWAAYDHNHIENSYFIVIQKPAFLWCPLVSTADGTLISSSFEPNLGEKIIYEFHEKNEIIKRDVMAFENSSVFNKLCAVWHGVPPNNFTRLKQPCFHMKWITVIWIYWVFWYLLRRKVF